MTRYLCLNSAKFFTQPSLSPNTQTLYTFTRPRATSRARRSRGKDTFVLQWPLLNLEEGSARAPGSSSPTMRNFVPPATRAYSLSPSLCHTLSLPPVSLRCRSQIGHKDLSKVIICCCSTSLREGGSVERGGRGDCHFPNAP